MAGLANGVAAEDLSIERLVASPSMNGPTVQGLKISPDGKRITYLRGKDKKSSQLDLWQFNSESGESSLLVDSDSILGGAEEVLSEEEKARRERDRSLTGKSGIVGYFWSEDSKQLMFPMGGDIYVMPLDEPAKRLTETPEFETDIRFSPKSTYVSFIRDRELFIINVKTGVEQKLTSGSTETIANGMAEFAAQGELGRSTGYWWSPDEAYIAFEQFDETGVELKERYEIQPDGSVIVQKQRYPSAGTDNALVKLAILSLADKNVRWLDLGAETDIYLARAGWADNSRSFSYQLLNRAQTQLDDVEVDAATGAELSRRIEKSDIWVNLPSSRGASSNDVRILDDGKETHIYTSEESGYRHIYASTNDGKKRAITSGDWVVTGVEKIDTENQRIYFSGHKDSPLEQHLYSVSFAGGSVEKITREAGSHSVLVGDGMFVDYFSSPTQPPQIMVRSLADGSTKTAILENKLDKNHPFTPYMAGAAVQEFGTIKADDGSLLHYRMLLPPNMKPDTKYPAIMAPYGGPHGQSVRKSWLLDINEILARKGFVVMVLDNRGTDKRGTAFEGQIKNAMGTVEVADQTTGAKFLMEQSFIDAENVGIWGWSYGGYMTLMSLFKQPDVFKAGVSVAPVTDWRLYDTAYTERYLGHPDAPGDVYENTSVFKYVDSFKGDLLLIHGMADDNVFFDNSVKLMSVLQNSGKQFELMTYPGKKHGIKGAKTRAHLYHQLVSFFERKLK
ncbi:MAG: DPP IV N-terminal domain-containing protein [Kordiimonadaceae bacterium]|nr:DPP IV N-terminal domain-containing protein [Kordiimonadaceae bacterium]